MSLLLQVFGHTPKIWTKLHFDLIVVDEESENHQRNWYSSSGEHEYLPTKIQPIHVDAIILLQTKDANLTVALKEKSRDHKTQ